MYSNNAYFLLSYEPVELTVFVNIEVACGSMIFQEYKGLFLSLWSVGYGEVSNGNKRN